MVHISAASSIGFEADDRLPLCITSLNGANEVQSVADELPDSQPKLPFDRLVNRVRHDDEDWPAPFGSDSRVVSEVDCLGVLATDTRDDDL